MDNMTPDFKKMGARFLGPQEYNNADLGPLAGLIGEWHGLPPASPEVPANGWNVMSVPGGPGTGFVFEVIPYSEILKFSPVIIQAGNRGPVVGNTQVEQLIFGLMYEQQITSECPGSTDQCSKRGFPKGTIIHAETGLFLNIGQPNGGYTIARLSTIPHGNSVLALGTSSQSDNPGTDFFPVASAMPTNLDGSSLGPPEFLAGYSDPIGFPFQFPVFGQGNPNSFLPKSLNQVTGSISRMTTLDFTTITPNANGGILNIPFINSNVDAHSMTATFWLENVQGGTQTQLLQYTQTINLVFPPTGKPFPVVWPHITINTLIKVDESASLLKDA